MSLLPRTKFPKSYSSPQKKYKGALQALLTLPILTTAHCDPSCA
jgi:hypothetical protein